MHYWSTRSSSYWCHPILIRCFPSPWFSRCKKLDHQSIPIVHTGLDWTLNQLQTRSCRSRSVAGNSSTEDFPLGFDLARQSPGASALHVLRSVKQGVSLHMQPLKFERYQVNFSCRTGEYLVQCTDCIHWKTTNLCSWEVETVRESRRWLLRCLKTTRTVRV